MLMGHIPIQSKLSVRLRILIRTCCQSQNMFKLSFTGKGNIIFQCEKTLLFSCDLPVKIDFSRYSAVTDNNTWNSPVVLLHKLASNLT